METVGIGAFMNTGLQSFGWNLKNINSAKLRSIDEYAFRGNAIEKVELPELTHRVRTGAFENNQITELQLGKYIAHVGTRAFKNNKIGRVVLADTRRRWQRRLSTTRLLSLWSRIVCQAMRMAWRKFLQMHLQVIKCTRYLCRKQ